jgi:diamine N-acetyltransferase
MHQTVIQNEQILIRETNAEDLDWVLETEGHPDNREYVYNWPRKRHLECIASSDERHFVIERTTDKSRVGYIILSGLDSEHEVISFDRITIAQKGAGYGRQAVRLIKKLCFETYGCHRLWLDVFDFNPQARRLYESEGFTYEGTLRDCKKRNDRYLSMHVLSMLAPEYKASVEDMDDLVTPV